MNILTTLYPWTKSLHIIAMVAWFAGLFYLPRLFVYHCGAVPGSRESETFKVMEGRLLRIIMNPAMIATWIFGLVLLFTPGVVDWSRGYMHAKLGLVVVLSAFHGVLAHWRRDFAEDRNTQSVRLFRVVNEIPTVLLFAIVILIVVKPF